PPTGAQSSRAERLSQSGSVRQLPEGQREIRAKRSDRRPDHCWANRGERKRPCGPLLPQRRFHAGRNSRPMNVSFAIWYDSGFTSIFVNYTSSPEAKYPSAINEVYVATKWVAAHGDEINVDGKHLAVVGNSAGSNMAAVTALKAKSSPFFGFL